MNDRNTTSPTSPRGDVLAVQSDAPLAGLTVVELGAGVAASYAGRILAMMGATVIKLERPRGGDALRHEPPLIGKDERISALFTYLNVNKALATLDVASSEGLGLLHELLGKAALFIDDTHPEERRTHGLDPAALCARHPALVYLSVLPFGAAGPRAEWRATEISVFHSSGEGYLLPNGLTLELYPERGPVKPWGHLGEFQGGTSAALAGMAALLAQPARGGQVADVSLQDANIALSAMNVQRMGDGVRETRPTRSFTYGGVLECKDGFVQILLLEQRQWKLMLNMLGHPDWATAEGMDDPMTRGKRGKMINEHLRAWARGLTVAETVAAARAAEVPLSKYNTPRDIATSPHERARGFVADTQLEDGTAITMPTFPFRLAESPQPGIHFTPGRPGCDNRAVYGGLLGHGQDRLDLLQSLAVI